MLKSKLSIIKLKILYFQDTYNLAIPSAVLLTVTGIVAAMLCLARMPSWFDSHAAGLLTALVSAFALAAAALYLADRHAPLPLFSLILVNRFCYSLCSVPSCDIYERIKLDMFDDPLVWFWTVRICSVQAESVACRLFL